MKKILMIVAVCAACATANAQGALKETKCGDNWSLGIDGGINTNLH